MGNIMKTIKIHGNNYVEVKERIKYFRSAEDYKGWSLTADFVEVTDTSCTMRAKVKNQNGITIATGSAREEKNNSNMNRSSFVEICETSAFGRALGNLGIGIDGAFASADEVKNAKAQEVKLKINKPTQDRVEEEGIVLKEKAKATITKDQMKDAVKYVRSGGSISTIKRKYKLTAEQEIQLDNNKLMYEKRKIRLDDKKFSAMIVAIGEGKEDIVKDKLPNYILSAKQEEKLTELLTK